jgi:hypothetical protein
MEGAQLISLCHQRVSVFDIFILNERLLWCDVPGKLISGTVMLRGRGCLYAIHQ